MKHGAFLPSPNPEASVLEVSVFRIFGLSDAEIWHIGDAGLRPPGRSTLYARGDLTVNSVERNQLQVAPDDVPPRHANIIGWPDEKSEQKLRAIELAANALLRVK